MRRPADPDGLVGPPASRGMIVVLHQPAHAIRQGRGINQALRRILS